MLLLNITQKIKLISKFTVFAVFLLFVSTITLHANTLRIISLAPIATENIYLLGFENQTIGITLYCPHGKTNKEVIGTLLESNLEKIVSLKPDIVFASKEGNKKATVEKLRNLGVKVVVLNEVTNFDGICSNLMTVAKALNKEEYANEIINNAKIELNKIKNSDYMQTVFIEIGSSPLITSGKNTFINDIINYAGAKNIFGLSNTRYPSISSEDVIVANPDIVIVLLMDSNDNYRKKYWLNFKNLKAAKNNAIYCINPEIIANPTPLSFISAVKAIKNLINEIKH